MGTIHGCFYTLGVLFVGVLITRYYLGSILGAPDYWKLPYEFRSIAGKIGGRGT